MNYILFNKILKERFLVIPAQAAFNDVNKFTTLVRAMPVAKYNTIKSEHIYKRYTRETNDFKY